MIVLVYNGFLSNTRQAESIQFLETIPVYNADNSQYCIFSEIVF